MGVGARLSRNWHRPFGAGTAVPGGEPWLTSRFSVSGSARSIAGNPGPLRRWPDCRPVREHEPAVMSLPRAGSCAANQGRAGDRCSLHSCTLGANWSNGRAHVALICVTLRTSRSGSGWRLRQSNAYPSSCLPNRPSPGKLLGQTPSTFTAKRAPPAPQGPMQPTLNSAFGSSWQLSSPWLATLIAWPRPRRRDRPLRQWDRKTRDTGSHAGVAPPTTADLRLSITICLPVVTAYQVLCVQSTIPPCCQPGTPFTGANTVDVSNLDEPPALDDCNGSLFLRPSPYKLCLHSRR